MEEYEESIRKNLDGVRARMKAAAVASGRDPAQILLLAATKTVPVEQINFAARECGLTDIGENKVQELLAKYDGYDKERLRIHFIGRLQRNKVKYIIDKVCLIHSLDSFELAAEIDRQAKKHGIVMDTLVEINAGKEKNKGGIPIEELPAFLEKIRPFDGIRVKGLMTVAPNCETPEEYLRYFQEIYEKFLDIWKEKPHNREGYSLSMGMSDSFEQAIACGSSLIRVGSAIFGRRDYGAAAPRT